MRKHVGMLLFAALASGPAQAYLDPGTGSVLLQAILAGIAAASAAAVTFWSRIKLFFVSRSHRNRAADHSAGQDNPD